MNLGGGENEGGSDGGQTQPEKEPTADQAQSQEQQGGWNQSEWDDQGHYHAACGMHGQWYPGPYEYGAWNFTKEEPKEEWKVVESKDKKKKKQEDRISGTRGV